MAPCRDRAQLLPEASCVTWSNGPRVCAPSVRTPLSARRPAACPRLALPPHSVPRQAAQAVWCRVREEGPTLLAHLFPLPFQLLPPLLPGLLLLGIQGSLLSPLRSLHLSPEPLQHALAALLQAGPLSLLQGRQLLSQPLQGSLVLGPGQTEGSGEGAEPSGWPQGLGSSRGHSPDLVRICLCAGLDLGPEPGQPPALLLSHPRALLLSGLLQLLLQEPGEERQGKSAEGPRARPSSSRIPALGSQACGLLGSF